MPARRGREADDAGLARAREAMVRRDIAGRGIVDEDVLCAVGFVR